MCPQLGNAWGIWNPKIPCLYGPKPYFKAHRDLFSWVHAAEGMSVLVGLGVTKGVRGLAVCTHVGPLVMQYESL